MTHITDPTKLAQAGWKIAVSDDAELRKAWTEWEFRSKDNKAELLKAAQVFIVEKGTDVDIDVDRFLMALKACVMLQKKWTLPNIDRLRGNRESGKLNLRASTYSIMDRLADHKFIPSWEEELAFAINSYDFGD